MSKNKEYRKIDKVLTFIVRPFLTTATKKSVDRRGGIIANARLEKRFKEIANDPWVKKSRERYE